MVVATAFQIASSAAAGNLDRPPGAVGDLTLETKNVVIEDGTEVEVEAGHLLVPENRSRQHSPPISIPFYRLRATGERPASPIFLLAGGPGSSWIDRFENEENFAEVQFYRSLADVVLFDQRGGGHSNPTMSCEEQDRLPLDRPLDRRQRAAKLQQMSARCRQHWIDAGVDLTGYTTTENVADVLALRTALGYEKMTLVGGSYGSHLALALMRTAPEAIDRVVLYGVEGVDHTWDDPAGRLAAYERIAGAIETSAELGSDVPEIGLVGILEEVIDRLEQEPVAVSVGDGDQQQQVIVDAELVRLLAGFQAGRFSRPNAWPEFLLDLYGGDYSFLARGAMALRRLELDDPMHYMMDCASGVSAERAERFRRDPARGVLGDVNFEYEELCRAWKAPDLGSEFRSAVVSDVPTLVVHGTWDTSTPIENAREVVSTLSHGHLLEVIGGNHGALYNLFERWPPVYDRLGAFLRGEPVRFPSSVTLPRPKLSPRQGD
ncbi:MAG: alpha/beta hydrolase [Thermoanaerobaculia bacterium]|nr:alpha/beta hydrolase [Thermoanaerobaculia bacterium]